MSFQAQIDRRDRTRFSGQRQQTQTQQWVARGPGILSSPPSNFNVDAGRSDDNVFERQGQVDGRERQGQMDNRERQGQTDNRERQGQMNSRGGRGFRGGGGGRSYMGRPHYLRRERNEPREGVGERGGAVNKEKSNQKRNVVDSDLPQLVQEIQEKLSKGIVECMICYDMVRRNAPVWSCSSCYSIFHLNCIKKWARAPTSADTSAEKLQGYNWRCPGCQAVQQTTSKDIRYICFCGKRHDPPSDLYLTPHSCGEPCGKSLERELPRADLSKEDMCPHLCVLQCHPGPCPPCKAFAPPRPCPCGKKVITTRCSERKSVYTCGEVCNKILECGRHHCYQICHVGPCEPCQVPIDSSCFCKKKSEVVICGELSLKGEIRPDDGLYSCSSTCGKKLKCGNHVCAEICHPGPCGECEFLPSKVKTCYCGKTNLRVRRRSCLDPIPTCLGTCGKLLPCNKHYCKDKCHAGNCSPCSELVTQKCRCGSTSQTVECYKTTLASEKFVCDRQCGRKKNCGRHRCSERCCPLSDSRNTVSGDWNPHFCSMPCGKKLKCGQHSCEAFCHCGHCPPCMETIFTDLTCACGRTSIPPPLPCGTPPPSCQYPCLVPQPCGHQSTHSCHFGNCPPCSVPIAKECVGGHVVLRNIPCGSKDITCNKLCGKTRRCGLHSCSRSCHPAPCDPSCGPSDPTVKGSCGQVCGAPRRDCRHTCQAFCHPTTPCPESRCEFPVTITCSCGRITAAVPCDAGGSNLGFSAVNVLEASTLQKLPAPLQPVEANEKRVPLGQRKLMCDDECAKLVRKRVLADAFDISQPSLDALHFGENAAVSQVVSELLRRDPKWVLAVEERCKHLVLGKGKGCSGSNIKVHVFCPMLKEKRDAIRIIAERWKLSINAAGWEPKRFIVVHATAKSKAPARIIGPKGSPAVSANHSPVFDPLVDMDPRHVVALLDLPSDADISTLVLRFGGECELVWLNDKNALAVFSDPARAATAMRRLDNGSVYQGAAVVQHIGVGATAASAWGGAAASSALKGNPWKKAVVKESNSWVEDSWGEEDWSGGSVTADVGPSTSSKGREAPVTSTTNRWTVLNPDSSLSSIESSARALDFVKRTAAAEPTSEREMKSVPSSSSTVQLMGTPDDNAEVADDWEKAYE
ncbi:NF-X1-type zinc finger protein NFXL1-like [Chenopodium quinoa]|uniref:NF-X1-type zinc finger protein NFXL1 n=1 Tax=Chenopodium quinoa TaxID=63459 RepID=A0A803M080_CHEQI|nr:NF-X1-type zinc finger protein NFXL1-like [Chenopodium quinoa]XP_021765041.1 NF-X1-type zinc finger protein NFXL1-like [Chenopodium quinoa]